MKYVLLILTTWLVLPVYSQDPAALSRQLTSGLVSEKDKVKAIFDWITQHIAYTVHVSYKQNEKVEAEDDQPLPSLDDRVAAQVLKRGTAFCDGYARLFRSLCTHAGIEAVCIQGYARNNWKNKPGRFGVNHYWNAVRIDGQWNLLDVTWASGFVNWQEEFVQDIDLDYYLAKPENFIRDHYPDDSRWTLLNDSPVPDEYQQSPFRHRAFRKYEITNYFPQKGWIEAAVGDTLRFLISSGKDYTRVSPDMTVDSTIFSSSASWIFLKPEKSVIHKGTFKYSLVIDRPGIEWVSLLYNGDMVLRYKVKIKSFVARR